MKIGFKKMFRKKPKRLYRPKTLFSRFLNVEQLEQRLTLDGDASNLQIFLAPPPANYLSDHMAVEVSRLAWEFDEWNNSEVVRGPFVQSEDKRVVMDDGHVLLTFAANTSDSNLLRQELVSIKASFVATGLEFAEYAFSSAWIPLASLNSLQDLLHVSYVSLESTENLLSTDDQLDTFVEVSSSFPSPVDVNLSATEVSNPISAEESVFEANRFTDIIRPLRDIRPEIHPPTVHRSNESSLTFETSVQKEEEVLVLISAHDASKLRLEILNQIITPARQYSAVDVPIYEYGTCIITVDHTNFSEPVNNDELNKQVAVKGSKTGPIYVSTATQLENSKESIDLIANNASQKHLREFSTSWINSDEEDGINLFDSLGSHFSKGLED